MIFIIAIYAAIIVAGAHGFLWLLKPVVPALRRMSWGDRATVAFVAGPMAVGALLGVGAGPLDLPLTKMIAGHPPQ